MRTASEWFELYGESHKNPINKAIHWVCIPMITLSTLGLLQRVPVGVGHLHLGTALLVLSMLFYVRLSWTIAVGMFALGSVGIAINTAIASTGADLGVVSAAVFFVAWLVQFVGHKIEGKKPSFFQDLQFLLVGPAWLLQAVYARFGVPVAAAA